MEIFNILLFQPLFNLLVLTYNLIPDLGIDIILITILIKLIFYPLYSSQLKSQKKLQDLQPLIDALKAEYKNDKEGMAREMMELYKNNKVNPLSSCLPLLIQIPILIAIYSVFRSGLNDQNFDQLYWFVQNPGHINAMFLGVLDLSKNHILLAVFAGIAQFFQTKMFITARPTVKSQGAKDEDMMVIMNKQMMYMMPILTIFMGSQLPGGLTLYWFVTTLLMLIQQVIFLRNSSNLKENASSNT